MKGWLPTPEDTIVVINGYKCAVGLLAVAPDVPESVLMVKQIKAGGPDTLPTDYELVHAAEYVVDDINARYAGDTKAWLADFFKVANPKLMKMTGDVTPEWPNDIVKQLLWLFRYGVQFRPETSGFVVV